MAKTVAALFDDAAEAQSAVRDLVNSGFRPDEIGLTANNTSGESRESVPPGVEAHSSGAGAATGAGIGAILGGIGGLLIGFGALTIPGIGPVLAAGPLAAGLVGLGVGAVAGGLIGALADLGIPEEEAHYYAEGVRRGGSLVTITTEDAGAPTAASILQRHGAVDIQQRASMWRERGWNGYNPAAPAFTAAEIARERQFRAAAAAPDPGVINATSTATNATMGIGTPSGTAYSGARIYDRGTATAEAAQSTPDLTVAQSGSALSGMGQPTNVYTGTNTPVTPSADRSATSVPPPAVGVSSGSPAYDATQSTGWNGPDRDFRNDFDMRFASAGHRYEEFEPAYRYGTEVASSGAHAGSEWDLAEPELRRNWESRNAGPWERVRDAIRFGWEHSRSRGRLDRAA